MNNKINFTSPVFKIVLIFLLWRLILVIISFVAIDFLPLGYKDRFLGGGSANYRLEPHFFSWANFDGEHYLSIAIFGYKFLEQAFFPVYPMLITLFSQPNPYALLPSLINSAITGLIISNTAFLFSLIFLWELLNIDFSKKITFLTIFLIIIFPTSFYFGAVYNESLFLLLSVLCFYNARKGRWFTAGIFGAVASATRIFGVVLLPALLIEAWQQKVGKHNYFWILMIPLGLLFYMLYQYLTVGDALTFYHLQKIVGEQHQSGLTLLPQVYLRYIKMIMTVDMKNPIYQTILLEFFVGLAFFLLPVYGYFKRIRISYLVYAMLGFLTPTIQGSFSSLPRYVIIFFPSFLAAALWINSLPKIIKVILVILSLLILLVETSLFLRGYWVA